MSIAIEVEGLTKVYEQGQRGAKPLVTIYGWYVQQKQPFNRLSVWCLYRRTQRRILYNLPTSL